MSSIKKSVYPIADMGFQIADRLGSVILAIEERLRLDMEASLISYRLNERR